MKMPSANKDNSVLTSLQNQISRLQTRVAELERKEDLRTGTSNVPWLPTGTHEEPPK